MCESPDLRDKSQRENKIVLLVRREKALSPMRASYDDHLKIEAEGAFVYGMLRHFTYVAGVFLSFSFFSSSFCLCCYQHLFFLSSILDGVSTWDWLVDIRPPAKRVMRTCLGTWRFTTMESA